MQSALMGEDLTIVRYLLGDQDDNAAAQIEERFFRDRAFFEEHVAAVEDILIRDYLQGQLNTRDTTLFEACLLYTSDAADE